MKNFKFILTVFLIAAIMISFVSCGKGADSGDGLNNTATTSKQNSGSPKNDTSIGLKDIKINCDLETASEVEKELYEIYDKANYFNIYSENIEQIQRLPDVYKNTKMYFEGSVVNVIKSNSEEFEILLQLGSAEENYIYVKGKQSNVRLVKDDNISVYGIYNDIKDYEIEGKSYNLPTIVDSSYTISSYDNALADIDTVKKISNYILGENCTVKEHEQYGDYGCYSVTLNNASAKYREFEFQSGIGGGLYLPYEYDEEMGDGLITSWDFEFMPDRQNYFVITTDFEHSKVSIEYFDKDWNKLWERDFENSDSSAYDFTENNIYLAVNNKLYIINTSNGQDTYEPIIVGDVTYVKKATDGILLFPDAYNKEVLCYNLDSTLKWSSSIRSNTEDYNSEVSYLQILDKKVIVHYYVPRASIELLRTINYDTGEIIAEMTIDNEEYY